MYFRVLLYAERPCYVECGHGGSCVGTISRGYIMFTVKAMALLRELFIGFYAESRGELTS